jgi:hypothetical protein
VYQQRLTALASIFLTDAAVLTTLAGVDENR